MTSLDDSGSIGQAFRLLGVTPRDGEDIVLATKTTGGMRHRVYTEALAGEALGADVFVATGRFRRGTVTAGGGRARDNVASVWALVADFDLKDFSARAMQELHGLEEGELKAEQAPHRQAVECLLRQTGLTPDVLASTGYGLSCWWLLPHEDGTRIDEAIALNKQLVSVLNHAAGRKLADPRATDCGTRVMRLPGSANAKNAGRPRESGILTLKQPRWTLNTLQEKVAALAPAEERQQPTLLPVAPLLSRASDSLSPDDEGDIVAAALSGWREGQRHDLALGLAGKLRRNDVPQWQAESIIERCCDLTGDDERGDRLTAVRTTYAGARVAGQSKLEGLLAPADVRCIDEVLTALYHARKGVPDRGPVLIFGGGASNAPPVRGGVGWPVLAPEARYGLAGEIVGGIEPHTEGDPAAVLLSLLVMVGSAIGRAPHFRINAARHGVNEFALIVGETAKARKGTAHDEAERIVKMAAPQWRACIQSGASSGEGIIHAVRDKTEGPNKQGDLVVTDFGAADKRLLLVEAEFSKVLKVAQRDGSTVTELIRAAWDKGDLQTLTRTNPLRATGAHVSIIGHITQAELLARLDQTDMANGLVNRFLLCCARRSKLLPFGGSLDDDAAERLARPLGRAIDLARTRGELKMTAAARNVWAPAYRSMEHALPGMLGAITSRDTTHVLRLALLFALLDSAAGIDAPHIEAALALWRYCEDSARYVFGDALGDPVADRVLKVLRDAPEGVTQNDLGEAVLGKNHRGGELARALEALASAGLAVSERETGTGGRPTTVWRAASLQLAA